MAKLNFSVDCLPAVFRDLIVNPDSVISDFYQSHFKVDASKGVHGLPILEFIGESRVPQPSDVKMRIDCSQLCALWRKNWMPRKR